MTVKEFVDNTLCVPVTRVGNKFIVEAIELVIDRKDHKFYAALSEITHQPQRYLETAIRAAKIAGLNRMSSKDKLSIFKEAYPENTTYVITAAEYYRRNYENKTQR